MSPGTTARRRLLVRSLPVLLAAPLLLVLTGGPASACSCAEQDPQQSLERAGVVFTGDVLRREAPSRPSSSTEKATYVIRVDRVYKGEATAVQEVVTPVSEASCGLGLPGSGPALLFADGDALEFPEVTPGPGQLVATLCGGSRTGSEVPAGFGRGRLPAPGGAAEGPRSEGGSGADPGDSALLSLGAAVVAAAAVAGAVTAGHRHLRTRRRRVAD